MSVIRNQDKRQVRLKSRKSIYELPAVIRKEKEDVSLEKALVTSLILHPVVFIVLLLGAWIFKALGIDLNIAKEPEMPPKDIEFVLVEKEAPPIDKNTKNRADKNSQAGGKHDPTRKVSMPEPPTQKPDKKPASSPKPAEKKQQQPKKTPTPQQPAPKSVEPTPKTPAPRPKPTPAPAPRTVKNPPSTFQVPVPKSSVPDVASPNAPLTPAPRIGGGSANGVKGGKGVSPAPTFSQSKSTTSGSGNGTGSGGRFSGTGNGSGNIGNPGPGNAKGSPGIDAIKEADFGPYMKELQRRIKMNWDPPKGNESKRVVLLFTISKDGRLISVKVHRSSGLPAADTAAVNAVKLTAPFRPLPPEFKGSSVDIQFTFDYNVLGAKMY